LFASHPPLDRNIANISSKFTKCPYLLY
jgi:hypothetical protein